MNGADTRFILKLSPVNHEEKSFNVNLIYAQFLQWKLKSVYVLLRVVKEIRRDLESIDLNLFYLSKCMDSNIESVSVSEIVFVLPHSRQTPVSSLKLLLRVRPLKSHCFRPKSS